jgi:hypothetical protein
MAANAEAERRRTARDTYLQSPRALPVCTRELDRLAAAVEERAKTLAANLGTTVEIRRAPGRCIVQLGPVALTLSWVRDRADTVANGCLLVGEWEGIVARGANRVPERSLDPYLGKTATMIREVELVADATEEKDWRWRRADADVEGYDSRQLAERAVDALEAGWRAKAQ